MRVLIRILGFELLDLDISDSPTEPDIGDTGVAAILTAKAQAEREGGTPDDVR